MKKAALFPFRNVKKSIGSALKIRVSWVGGNKVIFTFGLSALVILWKHGDWSKTREDAVTRAVTGYSTGSSSNLYRKIAPNHTKELGGDIHIHSVALCHWEWKISNVFLITSYSAPCKQFK